MTTQGNSFSIAHYLLLLFILILVGGILGYTIIRDIRTSAPAATTTEIGQ